MAAEFDLEAVDKTLASEWRDVDGKSVRDLADWFNKELLRSALRSQGRIPTTGEVDNLYRVLTDESVDAVERDRARNRLRQDGVDIADAERAMVSHQTLYRHLVNCLGTTRQRPSKSNGERLADWRSRIQALKNRTVRVTSRGIEQLQRSDSVAVGSADVALELVVSCRDCGASYPVEEFFDARSCDCHSPPDEGG
jgi:hypothetical protein